MDVLTFETCCALNNEIIKQVTSSWSIFIQQSRFNCTAITLHFQTVRAIFVGTVGCTVLLPVDSSACPVLSLIVLQQFSPGGHL